jgi:hypothetical protein
MAPEFTPDERAALAPYFTNLDGPVFTLVNLPEVVKGALFARYSRSPKSLRRLFLDEFLTAGGLGEAAARGAAWRAGDAGVIPGGVEHEAWFPEDTEVVDVFAPPREDFLTGETPAYMKKG